MKLNYPQFAMPVETRAGDPSELTESVAWIRQRQVGGRRAGRMPAELRNQPEVVTPLNLHSRGEIVADRFPGKGGRS